MPRRFLRIIGSLWRDPRYSSLYFAGATGFSKPNIPVSSLDFDSHPISHNQISPQVDEDGVSG